MNIAICDDESTFLNELKLKIYEYSNLHNWESAVHTFKSGVNLINCNIQFDIIILDYQMDELNGIETAKELRKGINQTSCIIFLTSYPEIAIPAYSVDTYRFVVKSTLYQGLYKALDDFRNRTTHDYDISVKYADESITITTSDISFIEVQNKTCYIHLSNGQALSVNTPLSQLYKEMPHTHFCKIHKSFIINFQYIASRGTDYVKVKNHPRAIPVSRKYSSVFKEKYYHFLKDNII